MKSTLLTSALIFGSAIVLQAATVSIANADFESSTGDLPGDGGWNNNNPSDWIVTGSVGMQDGDSTEGVTNYLIFIQGADSSVAQDISADAVIGGSVTVGDKFDLSALARNTNASPTFDFDIQDASGNSLIGGAVISSTLNIGSLATATASGTIDTASTEVFLFIRANGAQFLLDDVSLDYTVVPEPSSAALLGLGGLALILRRRK